jgi:hypothetical protein
MLVVGLVVGRPWIVPLGAIAWAGLLLASGTIGVADIPAAALLGGVNTAAGAALHWALVRPFRQRRRAAV